MYSGRVGVAVEQRGAAINLIHTHCSYAINITVNVYVAACRNGGSGVCSYVRRQLQPRRTNERTPESRCHINIGCNVYRIRTTSVNDIYDTTALFSSRADLARIQKDQDFDIIF